MAAAAFGELFEMHRPELLGIAFHRVGPNDAHDLVQTTAANTFRSIHTFQDRSPNRGAMPWFSTALRNAIIDEARKRQLRPAEQLANDPTLQTWAENSRATTHVDSPEQQVNDKHKGELVSAALAHLPAGQQELFRALYLEGLSLTEYCKRESLSQGTAKAWHYHGKARLRELIATGEIDLSF